MPGAIGSQVRAPPAFRMGVVAAPGAPEQREHLVDTSVLLDVLDHRGPVPDQAKPPENAGRRVADGDQVLTRARPCVVKREDEAQRVAHEPSVLISEVEANQAHALGRKVRRCLWGEAHTSPLSDEGGAGFAGEMKTV